MGPLAGNSLAGMLGKWQPGTRPTRCPSVPTADHAVPACLAVMARMTSAGRADGCLFCLLPRATGSSRLDQISLNAVAGDPPWMPVTVILGRPPSETARFRGRRARGKPSPAAGGRLRSGRGGSEGPAPGPADGAMTCAAIHLQRRVTFLRRKPSQTGHALQPAKRCFPAGRHHPDRPRAPVEATSMGGGRPGLLAAAVPDICQGSRFSLPPTNASRVAGVSCLLRQGRPPGMAGGADGNRSRLRNSVALGPRSAYGCAARRFTNGLPA
jgi:hypothetical protein